jgi:uncharacterized protein
LTYIRKKRTKEEKQLLQKKMNQDGLAAAIDKLENISSSYSYEINRNSKKLIHELLFLLKHEDQNVSLSISAANAISVLDSMSQDRRIESHIRTMLWQVVSNLESIRE